MGKLIELDELFRTADYVTLHIPRTKDTENLVNAELLRTMKPTARIVNCARGGVVDEAAISEAINNGVIAGAGLDVYASEPLAEDSPLRAVERGLVFRKRLTGINIKTSTGDDTH